MASPDSATQASGSVTVSGGLPQASNAAGHSSSQVSLSRPAILTKILRPPTSTQEEDALSDTSHTLGRSASPQSLQDLPMLDNDIEVFPVTRDSESESGPGDEPLGFAESIHPRIRSEVEMIFKAISEHELGEKLNWAKFWALHPDRETLTTIGEKPRIPTSMAFTHYIHVGFICDSPNAHQQNGCAAFDCPKLWAKASMWFFQAWQCAIELKTKVGGRFVSLKLEENVRMRFASLDWPQLAARALQDHIKSVLRSYNSHLAVWMVKRLIVHGAVGGIEEGYDEYFISTPPMLGVHVPGLRLE